MQILKLLDTSPVVASYEVLDFKAWDSGSYVKLKIAITNDTILHARQYIDEKQRHYSFHWQDENDKLICRWDNSCHHRHLKTFPHHKHLGTTVNESCETSLKEVLDYIVNIL